jgi:uncharacterized protein YdbL (DUF1318 family)
MRIQKGLAEVRERLARARQELRIAEEQELYLSEVLEDAKTRALVSETPLADREYQEARGDYERAVRVKEQVNEEIRELEAEQDRLLDRMLG